MSGRESGTRNVWFWLTVIAGVIFGGALVLWWHVEIVWPGEHSTSNVKTLQVDGSSARLRIAYPQTVSRGKETSAIVFTYTPAEGAFTEILSITLALPEQSALFFSVQNVAATTEVHLALSSTNRSETVNVGNSGSQAGLWRVTETAFVNAALGKTPTLRDKLEISADGWLRGGLAQLNTNTNGLLLLLFSSAITGIYTGIKAFQDQKDKKQERTEKQTQQAIEECRKAILVPDIKSAKEHNSKVKRYLSELSQDDQQAAICQCLIDIACGKLTPNYTPEPGWEDETISVLMLGARQAAQKAKEKPAKYHAYLKALYSFPVEKLQPVMRQRFDLFRGEHLRDLMKKEWPVKLAEPHDEAIMPLHGRAEQEEAYLFNSSHPLYWREHPNDPLKHLEDGKPGLYYVVAAPGAGKTALAMALYYGAFENDFTGWLAVRVSVTPTCEHIQAEFARQILHYLTHNLPSLWQLGSGGRLSLVASLLIHSLSAGALRAELDNYSYPDRWWWWKKAETEEQRDVWKPLTLHSLNAMRDFALTEPCEKFSNVQWLGALKQCASYLEFQHLRLIIDYHDLTHLTEQDRSFLAELQDDMQVVIITTDDANNMAVIHSPYALGKAPIAVYPLVWEKENLDSWFSFCLSSWHNSNPGDYLDLEEMDQLSTTAAGNPRRLLQLWHECFNRTRTS